MRIRSGVAGAVVSVALLAGCGNGSSGGAGGSSSGCLSPAQVSEEVNQIAEGFETSHEEVEAKQQEIAAVRAEAC
jgi:hypothetical protein